MIFGDFEDDMIKISRLFAINDIIFKRITPVEGGYFIYNEFSKYYKKYTIKSDFVSSASSLLEAVMKAKKTKQLITKNKDLKIIKETKK